MRKVGIAARDIVRLLITLTAAYASVRESKTAYAGAMSSG
jgi:hypothetical protein